MNCCRRTNRPTSGAAAVLLATLLVALPGASQEKESLEDRYQKAYDSFNQGKMEDACDLFNQVDKEQSNYKETSTYRSIACAETDKLYKMEKDLFDEGVRLMQQGQMEEAKVKFEQAMRQPLKNPKYRTQSQQRLNQIESQLGKEQLFEEAVRMVRENRDEEARSRFNRYLQQGGAKAAEARNYLRQLEERREDSAFRDAQRLRESGDLAGARRAFQAIIQLNGKRKADAQQQIEQIDRQLEAARLAEQEERAFNDARRAFDQGRFSAAKSALEEVVAMNGPNRGAAAQLLQQAEAALREEAEFQQAKRLYDQKNFDAAQTAFQRIAGQQGRFARDAGTYLELIKTRGQDPAQLTASLLAEARTAMDQKQYQAALAKLDTAIALAPGNREVARLRAQALELSVEAVLRAGLRNYLEGRYEEAEQNLTKYLENNGPKRALAFFFRGAARCSRYFLSGETDPQQKERALADFRALRGEGGGFRPPEKYVPPKILALYASSAGGGGN